MKPKKGVSSALLVILLGLIVIGLMLFGPLSGLYAYTKEKFFGEKGIYTTPGEAEREFVPYSDKFNAEEQMVVDSINSLVCAINFVATGNTDISLCNQREDFTAEKLVEIELGLPDVKVDVKEETEEELISLTREFGKVEPITRSSPTFTLSRAIKTEQCDAQSGQSCVKCGLEYGLGTSSEKITIKEVGDFVINCARRSSLASEDTFCGVLFLRNKLDSNINKQALIDWLKANSPDQEILEFFSDLASIEIRQDNEEKEFLSKDEWYYICADDDGANQIYLYDKPNYDNDCNEEFAKFTEETGTKKIFTEQSCTVQNFELPQDIEPGFSWNNPFSWVAGYGDPKYLAYYEAFPQGMEKFWHVDKVSAVSVGMIAGFAFLDLIPVLGTAKRVATKAIKSALKKGGKETIEVLGERAVREGLESFVRQNARIGWKRSLKKLSLKEGFKVQHFGVGDTLSEASAEIIDGSLGTGFSKFRRLGIIPSDSVKQTVRSDLENQLYEKVTSKITKKTSDFAGTIEDYRRKVAREMATEGVELYSQRMTRGLARELTRKTTIGKIFAELDEETLKDAVKQTTLNLKGLNPAARERALETGLEFVGVVSVPSGIFGSLKDSARTIARTYKQGITVAGRVAKPLDYIGIGALAWGFAAGDALNEKFTSTGMNSLGLSIPYAHGGGVTDFKLSEEAIPYSIFPKDQAGNLRKERFYIASPCKADLILEKEVCACDRMVEGAQHYRFSSEGPRIDLKGIELDIDALSDDDFLYGKFKQFNPNSPLLTSSLKDIKESKILEKFSEPGNAVLRQKYQILKDLDPVPQEYLTVTDLDKTQEFALRKKVIAALQRHAAVDFYDKQVNGRYIGAVKGFWEGLLGLKVVENPDEDVPIELWNEFQQYFDFEGAQKVCLDRGSFDHMASAAKTGYDFVGDTGYAFGGVSLKDNIYIHSVYKTPCITVLINRIPSDHGANYCIDEYSYMGTARWGLFAVEMAAVVGISVFTGGVGAPLALSSVGILSGVAEEWLAGKNKWPGYEREGAEGKVPVVETKISDEQIERNIGGPEA